MEFKMVGVESYNLSLLNDIAKIQQTAEALKHRVEKFPDTQHEAASELLQYLCKEVHRIMIDFDSTSLIGII